MKLACLMALATFASASASMNAQPIFRCGHEYSAVSCPNAQAIVVVSAVSAEQQAEARAIVQGEKALAADMARDRRAQEATLTPALATSLSAPRLTAASAPAKKPIKKRRKSALAIDDRAFLAAAPKVKKGRG